jgi:signal transduction histidine kinase
MRLSRFIPPRPFIQYIVVIVVGLFLAAWLTAYVREQSRAQAVLRLSQRAGQLTVAVQQSVNAKLQVLQAFQAFYAVGQTITRDEFKKFAVVTLTYHPDIQALQWIPLIMADELAELEAAGKEEFGDGFHVFERDSAGNNIPILSREFYFPIYYVEPMEGNQAAHGLDAGFESNRRKVLTDAWHTGKVSVSSPIRLVQETGNQYGVLLYQPIYNDTFPPETEAERINALIGLVPVVLRTGDFMRQSLNDFNTQGFYITLRDPLTPDITLYSTVPDPQMGLTPEDFSMIDTVTLANHIWEIEFIAPAAYVEFQLEFNGMVARYIVLGLTASIVLYLYQRNRVEASLRHYAATLEDTNRELDAYSNTIAHDLKSPLAVISGYAYLLMDESLSEEGRVMLDTIPRVTDNMVKMIDELLQLAKLRDAEAAVTTVDMNSVLETAIERFGDQRRFITIEETLPFALGHAPWLIEVFANLINNALKYTPDNRTPVIRIRGIVQGGLVRYEVQDNGVGIAPQDQERVFEMFTRLANTERQKGLGIGLSIVKRAIDRLEGEVGVESRLGDGSTFWFTLKAS